jgi:hypothetical protein
MDKLSIKELIIQAAILSNLSEDASPALHKKGLDFGFAGVLVIDGISLKILVGFDVHFPRHRPIYFLVNHTDIEYIPHIEDDGTICYTHDENLVMDEKNPKGIIEETFALAKKTLKDGISKKNTDDLLNEYEAYWNRMQDVTAIFTNVEITNSVEVIKVGKHKKDDEGINLFAVSDNQERINSITRFVSAENSPSLQNGLYIPLEKGVIVPVPRPKTQINLGFVLDLIFNNISPSNKKRLTEIIEKKTKADDYLIISFPKPSGNYAVIGVKVSGINHAKHPLLHPSPDRVKISPLSVSRLDKEYMLTRGGNGINFSDKKVLLIGGGSVGGYIADELIKSTILNVDIVDSEDLGSENCYRHICGFAYLNVNKAKALKHKLEQFFPHSEIGEFPNTIENLIAKKKINLNNYDAVIVATGNATINLHLTRYVREIKCKVPFLFSWLDPYGIGGHCLITNIADKGCYSCLYSNDTLHNNASFAGDKQAKPFLKMISGCASGYSPYSSLDANQTALLAVRKVVSLFSRKEPENAIYSWKGIPDLFNSEGFVVSERFNQTVDQLETNKSLFHSPKCEVCGK